MTGWTGCQMGSTVRGAQDWAEHWQVPVTIVQADQERTDDCAVVGCENVGRPQVCPYDGKYHHHGNIHYDDGHRWHPHLRFKSGTWRGICDEHMAEIKAGKEAFA